jgi:hypothetical protein
MSANALIKALGLGLAPGSSARGTTRNREREFYRVMSGATLGASVSSQFWKRTESCAHARAHFFPRLSPTAKIRGRAAATHSRDQREISRREEKAEETRGGEEGEGRNREIEYSIPATMTDKIGASTLARNVFIFETSTELILKV